MAVDYVCGMHVDEKQADFQVLYNEKVYYFCSQACQSTFEKDPETIIEARRNPWNRAGKGGCC